MSATVTTARFETFWDAYPRKVAKKAAQVAFVRLNPDHELFARLLDAIAAQKVSRQWRDGYIPYPATWLNGERWTDELVDLVPVVVVPTVTTKAQLRSQRNAAAAAAVIASFEAEQA